ncbi:universal stress protein [Streptomyces zhihengii]
MKVTGTRTDILVGIDPRDISVPVLAWAADEAERRNAPLRLVVSVPPCTTPSTSTPSRST